MEMYVCPKCGKRAMEKKETDHDSYILICTACGFKRGEFPLKDQDPNVV